MFWCLGLMNLLSKALRLHKACSAQHLLQIWQVAIGTCGPSQPFFSLHFFRQFRTFLDPLWTLLSLCSQVGLGAIYKANLFLSAEETIIDRE